MLFIALCATPCLTCPTFLTLCSRSQYAAGCRHIFYTYNELSSPSENKSNVQSVPSVTSLIFLERRRDD